MITLYHVSNPIFRESILKNGLMPKIGPAYSEHYMNKNILKAIFMSTKNDYDSTYDDDRYEITLTDKEFKSLGFKKDYEAVNSVFTTKPINNEKIKLIYKGSGVSTF